MPTSVHSISIPSSTRHLGKVRRFVEQYAMEADFPIETINSLQLAVDEACANIIEHAYSDTQRKADNLIDIDVIIKPDRFIVRIRDKGKAFEIRNYSAPDIMKYARAKRSGGFGVHLMRQLMDQVEYRTRGDSNECCLIKYRPKGNAKKTKTKNDSTTSSGTRSNSKPVASKSASGKSTRGKSSGTNSAGSTKSTSKNASARRKPAASNPAAKKSPQKKKPRKD